MSTNVADTEKYNPRFAIFAREQGEEPGAWLNARRDPDDGRVLMLPFTSWISERWAEYRGHLATLPRADRRPFDTSDHEAFDAWLRARAATPAPRT